MLEKLNLGKQGADLCSSPMTQLFVAAYFAERDILPAAPAWIEYVERLRDLYRRRRDVMLEALAGALRRAGDAGRSPEGGLFIWATLDGVDTTDLMARSEGVAFVPGRSAYMDVEGAAAPLDAAELRGRARRGHPRGHPPDRRDRGTGHGAVDGTLTGVR